MPDTIPASGTVHWLGTGLSTGAGLRVLADTAAQTVVWGRTEDKARRCLDRVGATRPAKTRAFSPDALAATVSPGDVVVSMLPAPEHAALARLSITAGAHFACSSYTSPDLASLGPAAAAAGVVVLTEAGLDPGIDHAMAHALAARARAETADRPAQASFTSYCGGVPAVPNSFRYLFTWAPAAVLTALASPARYLEAGQERHVRWPWEATVPLELDGETFEAYPNRDSLPFLTQYGFPAHWRTAAFARGTLRLDGWRAAWEPVFEVLRSGDRARVAALAEDLRARYSMTDSDRDRVVLAVSLTLTCDDGSGWRGRYLLDVTGGASETAMARLVSLPLACGVSEISSGGVPAGLHRAAHGPDEAARWLAFLARHGINPVVEVTRTGDGP